MNKQQVQQVLIRHIPQLAHKKVQLQRLSGLTNITYGAIVDGVYTYVYKKYSKDMSHAFQHKISSACSQQALGPKCIFFNEDYSISQFLPQARCPEHQEIVTSPLLPKIMQKMHRFHQLNDQSLKTQLLCTPSHYLFSKQQQKEITELKTKTNQNPNYQLLMKQILEVLQKREQFGKMLLPLSQQHIKVCHNDLNNLNIILSESAVYLIDYDYADYNFIAYDIANMINQTSIDYSKPTYPGFEIIKVYSSEEIYKITGHYPGLYPQLCHEVLRFMCVVNLYWAIWSLKRVQLNVSQIFGILQHGIKRMQLFHIYHNLIAKSAVSKQ